MKNLINIILYCVLASLLQNCIGSAYDKKLNGGYYLLAIDVKEDMLLAYEDGQYGIGIIEATVFSVGQNDNYIIAKQHPKISSLFIDKTVVNYFIIPLQDKISKSPEKNVFGPLTLGEFNQKRKELNIENVNFTIIFKELE